jgi:hypothetical protein
MIWIKRNLFFLIGSLVAMVLMGLAGWYLYTKWQRNNSVWSELNVQLEALDHLSKEKPHPGSGPIDNIAAAKTQREQLDSWTGKAKESFKAIPPIPPIPNRRPPIVAQDFKGSLDRTIGLLQREARAAGVSLPQADYAFSFAVQKDSLSFIGWQTNLAPLAVQVGEVKTICEILFQAKPNSLGGLRRERIAPEDRGAKAQDIDYLETSTVTSQYASFAPYELTFSCFSSELAAVLAGFANSPNGLIVKTINVEPVPESQAVEGGAAMGAGLGYRAGMLDPSGGAAVRTPAVAAGVTAGGLPTVLKEKQLQVTMVVQVVKLR